MADSNQVRINELARELEIKAKVLIEYLPEIGVAEKKTHSSSIENSQAELVRKHFLGLAAQESHSGTPIIMRSILKFAIAASWAPSASWEMALPR